MTSRRPTTSFLSLLLLSAALLSFRAGVVSAAGTIDNARQPSSSSPSPQPGPCALLFFGLPKSFKTVVLPSIRKYIVKPNPTCDIYLHTYNLSSISSWRNAERNAPIHVQDVYLLTNNVTIESMESFEHIRANFIDGRYHKYNPVSFQWDQCCLSQENMFKQWHSIRGVWDLMERSVQQQRQQQQQQRTHHHVLEGLHYERIGLFRSDVAYAHPIIITDPTEDAVVPAFLKYDKLPWINDRMFYGRYKHAKVWATKRFDWLDDYLQNNWVGRAIGLHSETFVRQLLDEFRVPFVERPDVCFWRVRANGDVWTSDCDPPPLPAGYDDEHSAMCRCRRCRRCRGDVDRIVKAAAGAAIVAWFGWLYRVRRRRSGFCNDKGAAAATARWHPRPE